MGSERSNEMSQKAARGSGENASIGAGPEEFPRNEEFEGANRSPGNLFGDREPRRQPSEGASLQMGLSHCMKIEGGESPDAESRATEELGEGRDESTGKPDGPEKGKVDNGGGSAKLRWG